MKKVATYAHPGAQIIKVLDNRLISPVGHDRDVRHYEWDLTGLKGMSYGTGDCLGVWARNEEADVNAWLKSVNLDPNTVLNLQRNDGDKLELPASMALGQLFTQVLDVFGRPSRRFYEFMSRFATDEKEKAQLKHLLTKEGKQDYMKLVKETVTYGDLLNLFPSCIPSLDLMAQHITPIKPRLYSIASNPAQVGEQVHLCVILDDWTTPNKKYRQGQCSAYMTKIQPGDETCAKMYPASIVPPALDIPIYMVALGTGIAPMMSVMQEREVARTNGEKVGPCSMLFGSRNRKTDFIYQPELERWKENGILENIFEAFSRDQAAKVYVQHRIAEKDHGDLINDYLYDRKGYFFLCGIGGPLETAVRVEIRKVFQTRNNLTDEQADAYIEQFTKEGRYNFETW